MIVDLTGIEIAGEDEALAAARAAVAADPSKRVYTLDELKAQAKAAAVNEAADNAAWFNEDEGSTDPAEGLRQHVPDES